MSPRTALAICLMLLLGAGLADASVAAAGQKRVRVIVEFKRSPGAGEVAAVKRAGGRVDHRYRIVPAVAARVPEAAIRSLRRNPRVAAVERDGRAKALDYRSTHDWGIAHVKADLVHADGNTGTGPKVAVLDTGIDCPHLELDSNCAFGVDYVDPGTAPDDDNGHGTHVAGAVAAERNAGVLTGVVGVAPTAGVVAYKVLDAGGYGYWSDIAAAIDHVWQYGTAQAINMSLGGSSAPSVVEEASNRAYGAGILLVAAAGNGGNCGGNNDSVSSPADYDSVVAVAAIDKDNTRPCWSATGPQVELSAPGVSTFSTWPSDLETSAHDPQPVCEDSICRYKYGSGTSMSSPHGAGAAALVLASGTVVDANDGAYGVADEVRKRLQDTAFDLGTSGHDWRYGYGLIDALAATSGTGGGGGGSGDGTTEPLSIASITPNAIGTGTTDVTIGGSGFVSGSTVSLENGKGPTPTVEVTGVSSDGKTLYARITVKTSGPSGSSQWDVRVQNPDGSTAVLVAGLTVTR